jgi:osmotically-inducible protein OsmY
MTQTHQMNREWSIRIMRLQVVSAIISLGEGTNMLVATVKSDRQIQQEVMREMRWDSRVDETEIGVEVDKGVVTLRQASP